MGERLEAAVMGRGEGTEEALIRRLLQDTFIPSMSR
jgi:hypothetical protein